MLMMMARLHFLKGFFIQYIMYIWLADLLGKMGAARYVYVPRYFIEDNSLKNTSFNDLLLFSFVEYNQGI